MERNSKIDWNQDHAKKGKKRVIRKKNLTELLGISNGHLSCVERGCYLPTTQNLFKLCDILGETPNYYLIGEISVKRETNIISLIKTLPENYQKAIENSVKSLVDAYTTEIQNLTNK